MLHRAAAKSEALELYGHNKQSEENPSENLTGKTAILLQNLINLVEHNKYDDNDNDNNGVIDELSGLQNRARILLEQN